MPGRREGWWSPWGCNNVPFYPSLRRNEASASREPWLFWPQI